SYDLLLTIHAHTSFILPDVLRPAWVHFAFAYSRDHRHLHSFPTRRSSDLVGGLSMEPRQRSAQPHDGLGPFACRRRSGRISRRPDRKSTRLNSSHVASSYAVFCLKKKKLLGEQLEEHTLIEQSELDKDLAERHPRVVLFRERVLNLIGRQAASVDEEVPEQPARVSCADHLCKGHRSGRDLCRQYRPRLRCRRTNLGSAGVDELFEPLRDPLRFLVEGSHRVSRKTACRLVVSALRHIHPRICRSTNASSSSVQCRRSATTVAAARPCIASQ